MHTFTYIRHGSPDATTEERDVDLDFEIARASPVYQPLSVPSEHPLYLLYTSGSTGRPKGLLHSTAGVFMGVYMSLLSFQESLFSFQESLSSLKESFFSLKESLSSF